MSSENKKNKLKNSYCAKGLLKEKKSKLKRTLFYTSSLRKKLNDNIKVQEKKVISVKEFVDL